MSIIRVPAELICQDSADSKDRRMQEATNAGMDFGMKKETGLTLFDLLVTIAIVAVTLSIGVPSYSSVINTNRVATNTNDLLAALYSARSEAVKRVVPVTVCKSIDLTVCDPSIGWHDGWIVFIDSDADGLRTPGNPMEEVLGVQLQFETGNTLQSAAFGDRITFAPDGLVTGSSGNFGSFLLCNESRPQFGREVSVSRTGSVSTDEAGDGVCP